MIKSLNTRPFIITAILVISTCVSCNSPKSSNQQLTREQDKTHDGTHGSFFKRPIDTSRIVMLPYSATMPWVFDSTYRPASLSMKELEDLEDFFEVAVNAYNHSHASDQMSRGITQPWLYNRQYIAAINRYGEKEVYVNCLCADVSNWKTSFVMVDDGGNCYFQFIVNLTKKTYRDFSVNGVA